MLDDDADGYSQVTVNVPSGGGSGEDGNIIYGINAPTSSIGDNGDLYFRIENNYGLKNSSGPYINTGYNGSNDSEYHIEFKLDADQTDRYPSPFGARTSESSLGNCSYVQLGYNSNYNVTYVSWGNSEYNAFNIGPNDYKNKRITIDLSAGECLLLVDNDEYRYTFTPSSIVNSSPIGIYAMIINGQPSVTGFSNDMILYKFEIKENGQVLHRFVPAKDANDIPCVFDEITQEYKYPNTGVLEYIDNGIWQCYCKKNGVWVPINDCDISDITFLSSAAGEEF